jgi:hypothetical protein
MMTRSSRRKAIPFLHAVVFATAGVCAAGPRAAESARPAQIIQPAPFDLLNQLWNRLRSFWSEEGCRIDPNGRCAPQSPLPPPRLETGCHIDPSGACQPVSAPAKDTGCNIDPNGRCRS